MMFDVIKHNSIELLELKMVFCTYLVTLTFLLLKLFKYLGDSVLENFDIFMLFSIL